MLEVEAETRQEAVETAPEVDWSPGPVARETPRRQGLANVNPIFTWVRLVQRIPVRIHIGAVPEGVVLAAGMTVTVQIDPRPRQRAE
jgi:multidrug resistance efflux pump